MSEGDFFTKSAKTFLKQWTVTDPVIQALLEMRPQTVYNKCLDNRPHLFGGFLRTVLENREKTWKEIQEIIEAYLGPEGKGDVDIKVTKYLVSSDVRRALKNCNAEYIEHGSAYSDDGMMITAWLEGVRYEIIWDKSAMRPGLDFTCNALKYDLQGFQLFGYERARKAIMTRTLEFGTSVSLGLLWRMVRLLSLGYQVSDEKALKAMYKINFYLNVRFADSITIRSSDLSAPVKKMETRVVAKGELLARADFQAFFTQLKFQAIRAVTKMEIKI